MEKREINKSKYEIAKKIGNDLYNDEIPIYAYHLIGKCIIDYHFEAEVIYNLFFEAKKMRILYKSSDLKRLAEEWFQKRYVTIESLKPYYDLEKNYEDIVKVIGEALDRRLNTMEKKRIRRWSSEYKYNSDIVLFAFNKLSFSERFSLDYLDKKLSYWYKCKVHSISDAKKIENMKTGNNYRDSKGLNSEKRSLNSHYSRKKTNNNSKSKDNNNNVDS